MKRIALFSLILLLCCGIGYTIGGKDVVFTVEVPNGKGTIKMDFTFDSNWGWGWGIGNQHYNTPCVPADTEGELIIPDSITTPDGSTMPVKWISQGSFQSCPNLTRIQLPSSIMAISDLSFSGCTSLREITLPDSLVIIYPQAFLGCTGLRRVRFPSFQPPRSYYDTFEEVTYATATLVIPVETAEWYLSNPLTHRFRYHAEVLPLYKENEE